MQNSDKFDHAMKLKQEHPEARQCDLMRMGAERQAVEMLFRHLRGLAGELLKCSGKCKQHLPGDRFAKGNYRCVDCSRYESRARGRKRVSGTLKDLDKHGGPYGLVVGMSSSGENVCGEYSGFTSQKIEARLTQHRSNARRGTHRNAIVGLLLCCKAPHSMDAIPGYEPMHRDDGGLESERAEVGILEKIPNRHCLNIHARSARSVAATARAALRFYEEVRSTLTSEERGQAEAYLDRVREYSEACEGAAQSTEVQS